MQRRVIAAFLVVGLDLQPGFLHQPYLHVGGGSWAERWVLVGRSGLPTSLPIDQGQQRVLIIFPTTVKPG